MKRSSLLLLPLALTACGPDFKPASYVDKLRVLAVQAEPPEIEPLPLDGSAPRMADRARLASLIADPAGLTDPDRVITVVYLACTPDPLDPFGSSCTQIAALRDPSQLGSVFGTGAGAGGPPGGTGGAGGGTGGAGGAGGAEAPTAIPPISLAGIEVCTHAAGCGPATIQLDPNDPASTIALPPPAYVLPPQLRLDLLPTGVPSRTTGLNVTVVTIAIAASPAELLGGADLLGDPTALQATLPARLFSLLETRENVLAIKRIKVRGPDDDDVPNVNPILPGLTAGGAPLPAVLTEPLPEQASWVPGQVADLLPRLPAPALDEAGAPLPQESIFQRFTRRDVSGEALGEEDEEWLYSWFTTGGTLDKLRTRGAGELQAWLAPRDLEDEPIPEGGRVFLYAVVRDLRGGVAWAKHEVRVASKQ